MSQAEIHAVASEEADHAVGQNEDEDEINVQLTNHQVYLIKETWKLVREDLEKAGMIMFTK